MKAQLEKISSPPQNSFKIFEFKEDEFDAPWHFHPEFELTFIVKSGGMRYVGDSVMEFEAEDLVLIGENLPHCWKNTEDNKEKSQSIVVQWGDDVMGAGWLNNPEFAGIARLLWSASRGVQFETVTVKKVAPLLVAMLKQEPFDKILTFLRVLKILSESKNKKYLSGVGFTSKLTSKSNERINKVHNFVKENYHRPIKLSEVASLVSMGEEPFCRFFKKTFNKTFFFFLNEYKINLACKFLIESDKRVSEVAFLSGYESLPFFYKQFKKLMGCSPLVYQKKYRKINVN
ncbi:AraC family transcriptional regulator [Postechiella marina]|uniref:AraC family transcriptional regulator n=1 Tax=Postechiella marina TaxID=943941 RepID=A0ABP8CEN5_9FLAO